MNTNTTNFNIFNFFLVKTKKVEEKRINTEKQETIASIGQAALTPSVDPSVNLNPSVNVDPREKSAIIVQQAFRRRQAYKQIRQQLNASPSSRRAQAARVANQLDQKGAEIHKSSFNYPFVSVSPHVREPIENLTKVSDLIFAKEKFAKLVTYERFLACLEACFKETLANIISLPEKEREYVIIADNEKSTNWVASLLLNAMAAHPPQGLVDRARMQGYLVCHPEIRTVVMIDDGAYSGEQASRYMHNLGAVLKDRNIYISIPYMTSYGKKRIELAIKEQNPKKIFFCSHQMMLTYKELKNFGFIGYTKISRPDLKQFLSLKSISGNGEPLEEFNTNLTKLKSEIFKIKTDQEVVDRIRLLINQASLLLAHMEQPSNQEQEIHALIEGLRKSENYIERGGIDKTLESKEDISFYQEEKKTGTWMAHKSADHVSTEEHLMNRATGNKSAIEPYKEDEYTARKRTELVEKLKENNLQLTKQWDQAIARTPIEDILIVQSNRGYFLLANNYCVMPKDNKNQATLIVGDEKIPFGGKTGSFQFKLTDGLNFSIEMEGTLTHFTFKDGCIKNDLSQFEIINEATSTTCTEGL